MRMIDLSFPIAEGMFRFPREYHPRVRVEVVGTYQKHRCQVRRVTLGTHTGTHVDAPRHFFPAGATIDSIPLEMLVTEAALFDAPGAPGDVIGRQHLPVSGAPPAGEIQPGQTALLRTGWWRRWGADFYDNPPRLDVAAASKLLDAGVAALAVDFPVGIAIHQLVLGRGRLLIENICRLDEIRARRFWLVALPLKIADGDGAPARVVAVEAVRRRRGGA
jgi:kynurenine formamidase